MIPPKVGYMMGPIKRSLREALLTMLFGGEDVNDSTQEIILHRVKCDGLGIPDPRKLLAWSHVMSEVS